MHTKLSPSGAVTVPSPSPDSLLASVPVKAITYIAVVEVGIVILVSYTIAVSLGHVPAWLPMISDCAVHSPEEFIFRYGLLFGATMVAVNVVVVYAATRQTYRFAEFCLGIGLFASFNFGLLTDVNESENDTIHTTAAVLFFGCYEVYMIIISYYGQTDPRVTRLSLNMKRVASLGGLISLLTLVALSPQFHKHHTAIAVCEWVSVLMIQIFNVSFVQDLAGIKLNEVGRTAPSDPEKIKLIDSFA